MKLDTGSWLQGPLCCGYQVSVFQLLASGFRLLLMESSTTRRVGYVLDGLWNISSAVGTLMVLLSLLAITLAAMAVLAGQQVGPSGATTQNWFDAIGGSYQGTLLRGLQNVSALGSFWLRLLLTALAFNIALRLALQASALAQGWQRSAARHRLWLAGPLLAYFGMLMLLAGLLVNNFAGWRITGMALAPGDRAALAPVSGLQVELDDITGSDPNPESALILARASDGLPVSLAQIAYGRPARWGDLWLAQRAAGPTLEVKAKDASGRPLLLQSLEPGGAEPARQGEVSEEIRLLFRQTQAEQTFALPAQNLAFRVVSYPSLPDKGINEPVFLVEVYREDEPAPTMSELVTAEGTLVLDRSAVYLRRGRYAIVETAYLPGTIPVILGGFAILIGIILAFLPQARTVPPPPPRGLLGPPTGEPSHAD